MKRILMGLVALVALVATLGAGTLAYFNDTEASTGTFAAGTLDLKVSADGTNYSDSITEGVWTLPNMKPGDSISHRVSLQNSGTVPIGTLQMSYFATGDTDLLKSLIITSIKDSAYNGGTGGTEQIGLFIGVWGGGDGKLSLFDLVSQGQPTNVISPDGDPSHHQPLPQGATITYDMTIQFNEAGVPQNDLQGKSANLAITFIADQN